MRNLIVLLFLIMSSGILAQDVENGSTLFRNHCKACHSIDQKLVGPALKDVHLRRDSAWIYSFVKSSQSMIANGDSIGMALFMEFNQIPMPDQPLVDDQISDVMAYIIQESQPKSAEETPIPRPAVDWGPYPSNLSFDNYLFWIPYTITVIMLIVMLYYMTVVSDFFKQRAAEAE